MTPMRKAREMQAPFQWQQKQEPWQTCGGFCDNLIHPNWCKAQTSFVQSLNQQHSMNKLSATHALWKSILLCTTLHVIYHMIAPNFCFISKICFQKLCTNFANNPIKLSSHSYLSPFLDLLGLGWVLLTYVAEMGVVSCTSDQCLIVVY